MTSSARGRVHVMRPHAVPPPGRAHAELICSLGTIAAEDGEAPMDSDLAKMSRDELVAEVLRLREAIRAHRDGSGHELCWYHPDLWGTLPETSRVTPVVPEWPVFLRGCIRYRQSLDEQLPRAPRSRQEYGGD